jgi:phosphoglycerate dehydrogenase-like enzyme
MKIAILNDSFFTEEHLADLKSLGTVEVYEGTSDTDLAIERTANADIVLGDQYLTSFDKHYFDSVPNVKLLALNTIGYNLVDIAAAKEKGTMIANVPGFSKRTVAELAVGLMFDVARRISYGDRSFRNAPFEPDPVDTGGREFIGFELAGKTMGIIGLGQIGTELSKLAEGIGMNVIAWNRHEREDVSLVSLEELMRTSDVVAICVVSSEETKNLVSKELLNLMKPRSVLISIARPEVLDTEALTDLLMSGKIWGAALDMSGAKEGSPLLTLKNVVLTPHIGSYTEEAFYKNLPSRIVENVNAFIAGTPQNIVNL